MATNVVASRPPERQPTGTPHTRVYLRTGNSFFLNFFLCKTENIGPFLQSTGVPKNWKCKLLDENMKNTISIQFNPIFHDKKIEGNSEKNTFSVKIFAFFIEGIQMARQKFFSVKYWPICTGKLFLACTLYLRRISKTL